MYKYKLWILLVLIVIAIGALLFALAPSQTIAKTINNVKMLTN